MGASMLPFACCPARHKDGGPGGMMRYFYDWIKRGICMNDYCASGICPVDVLNLNAASREWLDRLCPQARSVVVYLFPYFAGERPGNLSLYARGRDYHAVIRDALAPEADAFRAAHPDNKFIILTDDSPIPEVYAAAAAGLGSRGENGLLIHPVYGSYVFIGTIVSDCPFPAETQAPSPCLRCGKCRSACPAGAISEKGINASRCLSALTQRGGELTTEEAEQLRRHPLIWGCDCCQQVCPMNRDIPLSENPVFRESLIDTLTPEALEGLTRRAFSQKYPDRAFTWRGPAPLRRNLALSTPAGGSTNETLQRYTS